MILDDGDDDTQDNSTCIDCGGTHGVELRWPGYGHRLFARCEPCGEKRIQREKGNISRNFQRGPTDDGVGPFDPADAGEEFGDEDL